MQQKVYDIISTMEPQLIDMVERWIAVPSVKDEAAPGAPFGKEVRRMLDLAIADVEARGFPARDYDGYAVYADEDGTYSVAFVVSMTNAPEGGRTFRVTGQ